MTARGVLAQSKRGPHRDAGTAGEAGQVDAARVD